jgi:hypothetical protein
MPRRFTPTILDPIDVLNFVAGLSVDLNWHRLDAFLLMRPAVSPALSERQPSKIFWRKIDVAEALAGNFCVHPSDLEFAHELVRKSDPGACKSGVIAKDPRDSYNHAIICEPRNVNGKYLSWRQCIFWGRRVCVPAERLDKRARPPAVQMNQSRA